MQNTSFLIRCCGIFATLAACCFTVTFADEDGQITIMSVKGRDARDLGKTLDGALNEDDVQIQIDQETNLLMVKGSKRAVERTAQLLNVLDPTPTTVTIEVEISISDPDDDSQKVLDRLLLSVLENNSASLQFGQQVAVVTGRQSFGSRGTQVQTQNQQTGTLVKAKPRVAGGGVMLELYVEKSWLEYPVNDLESEGDAANVKTPTTYTLSLDTMLRLETGKSQTIESKVSGGASVREAEITVFARTGAATSSSAAREAAAGGGRGAGTSNLSRRSSGGGGRGGFGRGRGGSGSPGGRGGSSIPSGEEDRAEQIATVVFGRMDSDGDGKIDSSERERNSRMLKSMGLVDSDQVTVESLMNAIKSRAQRSSRPASAESKDADSDQKDSADKD